MAVTERDVQRMVDAMPVLDQRVVEIEKNASSTQIVNNNVVDQASAKFANIELQGCTKLPKQLLMELDRSSTTSS